jgi:hypothetical protein
LRKSKEVIGMNAYRYQERFVDFPGEVLDCQVALFNDLKAFVLLVGNIDVATNRCKRQLDEDFTVVKWVDLDKRKYPIFLGTIDIDNQYEFRRSKWYKKHGHK